MSSGFDPKNSEVMQRSIEVARLVIPFKISANPAPASKVLASDEASILFLGTEGETQLSPDPNPPPPPDPGPAGPAPDMATLNSFVVLAASTITNTGSSVLNGDLGLSPGTVVSGFPPGSVSGTQHVTDAAAAQAQIDLTAAYTDLQSRPPGTAITAGGGGLDALVLLPGTYTSATTMGLSVGATLTLDSGGNNDAVWIFQVGSSLTLGNGSTVAMIGGSPGNVFWQMGASATIGTTAVAVGNFLAQASVTLQTGASLDGRALARTAAVTLDDNAMNEILPPPSTGGDSRFDLIAQDAAGNFNLMVDVAAGEAPVSNGDRPVKIMQATIRDRITGAEYPCYQNQIAPAIVGSQMFLNCDSSLNAALIPMDACLIIEYTVHE